MRKRLAIFAEGGDFREGVTGTREKLLGRRWVKGNAKLLARSLIELGIGKVHGGVIAIDGDAGPGNVHGRGIENGDSADGTRRTQGLPALDGGLIVRGESR